MQVDFYQLEATTQSAYEAALPQILTKALAAEHVIAIVAPTNTAVNRLDERLWSADATSFLPHDVAKKGIETTAAVVLFSAEEPLNISNKFTLIISLGGGLKELAFPDNIKRCLDMFTSQEAQVKAARTRWKSYKEAEHTLSYYAQTDQGWQKKSS